MLLRSPGFSFIAIATMALGVGATTAMYSVIDATPLHPLPYPNPGELVRVEDNLPGVGAQRVGISIPEWRDLESSGIFQAVSIAGQGANVNLTGSAQPLRLSFKQVTPNYFAVLGVDAQLGRTFNPHDDTPGYNLEVVISDGLWRREFGADPHILGKALAQTKWTVRLIPLSESVVGNIRQSLILLFSSVGLVLLISCVNVANLLLARASGRGQAFDLLKQCLHASQKAKGPFGEPS